mgnify:FL=1
MMPYHISLTRAIEMYLVSREEKTMNTLFITGASSGIGRETARYFARHGWRVIATMRNPQKAGELADMSNIETLRCESGGHDSRRNQHQLSNTCQHSGRV